MRRAWARANLTPDEAEQASDGWWNRALDRQYPSRAVKDIWLVMGGRGSGKTRLGAEWTCGLVKAYAPFSDDKYRHIALVEPVRAMAAFGAGQSLETVSHRITLRFRSGVASGMRFVRGSRVFDIVTVHDPDETGRYLVCRAQEKGL